MGKHRKDSSLFQLIDRKLFDGLVLKWGMDKGVRSFSTWEMTCALVNCMTMRLGSYREVEQTLRIPRSTLGDAMIERSHGFFEDLCDLILLQIRGRTKDRKVKRAIREILAIDSSECSVHGSMFTTPGWSQRKAFGHQASCKLHVVWNVGGDWVEDFIVTGGRKHDSPVSLYLRLTSNKIYVFDRAYNDLSFWLKITDAGSHFVTRLKDCAKNRALRDKILRKSKDQDGVLYDGDYEPSAVLEIRHRERLKAVRIRHIIYRDPETKKVFHFATSDLRASAQTIADIYKQRWAVELLFRWLKGHLNIRYLPVKDTNAVKIQLASSVLVQLLLRLKKILMKFDGTLWALLRLIRSTLVREALVLSGVPDGCRWKAPPGTNLPCAHL